jgi:hypothetical protein
MRVNDKERKKQIINFVKNNQFCSKDAIFQKGKIPKSTPTNNLIETLVSQKKIKTIPTENGKIRYYVHPVGSFDDWVKWAELSIIQGVPLTHSDLERKILEFFRIRLRVLKAEGRNSKTPRLNFKDTMDMINWIHEFQKNPSPLFEFCLMDMLRFAIKDDKYYLKHQLHSNPREIEHPFQIIKKRHLRRSVNDLLLMKKKGRHEYSLTKLDYKKNMEKITDDPRNWLERFFAEEDRSLYQNDPNLKKEIFKKNIDASLKKLKPGFPRWKERRELALAMKEFLSKNPPDETSINKFLQTTYSIMTDDEKIEFKNFCDKRQIKMPFPV